MHKLAFGITVGFEAPAQLAWCLGNLRNAYPDARVFVITDGFRPDAEELKSISNAHGAEFHEQEKLIRLDRGAEWWHRFFALACLDAPTHAAKVDPDTWVHRPLVHFPDAAAFGRVENRFLDVENLQGGFQVFSRTAMLKMLVSGEPLHHRYRDQRNWNIRNVCRMSVEQGKISTDFTLMAMLRRLGLKWAHSPEIDSWWHQPPRFKAGAAVTHPHKNMAPNNDAFARVS